MQTFGILNLFQNWRETWYLGTSRTGTRAGQVKSLLVLLHEETPIGSFIATHVSYHLVHISICFPEDNKGGRIDIFNPSQRKAIHLKSPHSPGSGSPIPPLLYTGEYHLLIARMRKLRFGSNSHTGGRSVLDWGWAPADPKLPYVPLWHVHFQWIMYWKNSLTCLQRHSLTCCARFCFYAPCGWVS